MWSFYGLQKRLLPVTLTIYGRGGDTHGAGPWGGRFRLVSSPSGRAQEHPSRSVMRDACLPTACGEWAATLHLLLLLALLLAKWPPRFPSGKCAGGLQQASPRPSPSKVLPSSTQKPGLRKAGRGERFSPLLLWGCATLKCVSSHCRAAFLAGLCLSAALLSFLRRR